ncbi:MAG: hypothetical protein K2G39_07830, partial [Lachnospiraceae bacterium]|nr:hypothetical protein [Lachnospiraceae bacterium]
MRKEGRWIQQEDRRLNKAFSDAYRNVKAPEALKKGTLNQMLAKEEGLKRQPEKVQKRKLPVWYYGAMAAAVCVVVFWVSALRSDGITYVTMIEEGVFYEEVELKDGWIRFLPNRVIISISPNAGQAGFQGEDKNGLPVEKETEPEELIQTKSGGQLKFFKTDGLLTPELAEEDWSYIGEQKIYVSVLKTDGVRFHAIYERGGSAYEVIGENVTQKEFI